MRRDTHKNNNMSHGSAIKCCKAAKCELSLGEVLYITDSDGYIQSQISSLQLDPHYLLKYEKEEISCFQVLEGIVSENMLAARAIIGKFVRRVRRRLSVIESQSVLMKDGLEELQTLTYRVSGEIHYTKQSLVDFLRNGEQGHAKLKTKYLILLIRRLKLLERVKIDADLLKMEILETKKVLTTHHLATFCFVVVRLPAKDLPSFHKLRSKFASQIPAHSPLEDGIDELLDTKVNHAEVDAVITSITATNVPAAAE